MSSLILITPYFWKNRFKLLAGLLSLPHALGFLQAHLDHHARQVRAALRAN